MNNNTTDGCFATLFRTESRNWVQTRNRGHKGQRRGIATAVTLNVRHSATQQQKRHLATVERRKWTGEKIATSAKGREDAHKQDGVHPSLHHRQRAILTAPKQHEAKRKHKPVRNKMSLSPWGDQELVAHCCLPLLTPTWSYLSFFGNSYLLHSLRTLLLAVLLSDMSGNFSLFGISWDSGVAVDADVEPCLRSLPAPQR